MSEKSATKKPRNSPSRQRERDGVLRLRSDARRRSRSPGPDSRIPKSPPRRSSRAGDDRPRSSPRHGCGSPAHRSGSESSPGRRPSPRLGGTRVREASQSKGGSPGTTAREFSTSPAHGREESEGRHRTRSEDIRRGASPSKWRDGRSTLSERGGRSGESSPKKASPQGFKMDGRSREYRASPLSRSSSARDCDRSTKDQDKKGDILDTLDILILSSKMPRRNSLLNVKLTL